VKLVTTKFKSGGLHGKQYWQLGILGTISVFSFRHRETKCINLKILITSFRAQDVMDIIVDFIFINIIIIIIIIIFIVIFIIIIITKLAIFQAT